MLIKETVSRREAKAKRWSGHMVSLLWRKSISACLTASIRLTAGRAGRGGAAGSMSAPGPGEPVEPEEAGDADADAAATFISERASASTSTQKRMSSSGRRLGGSENSGEVAGAAAEEEEDGGTPWRGAWSMGGGWMDGRRDRVGMEIGRAHV